VGTPDLAPFTASLELSLTKLEELMVTCRVYLVMIVYKLPLLPLWRAHKLNLKFFRSEKAHVSGNQPGKRENGAAGDIVGDFSDQCCLRSGNAMKFYIALCEE
jgi:hypothetical protein